VTHDELINSLAEMLCQHRLVIPNVHLGSAWTGTVGERGIVDLISISYHYKNPDVVIYEIKASRADLFGDIKREKWRKYCPHCHRVVFAFEKGMAKPEEVPIECGVVLYSADKKTWSTRRRGVENESPNFDLEMFMSLMFALERRIKKDRTKVEAMKYVLSDQFENHIYHYDLKAHFGEKVSNAILNFEHVSSGLKQSDEALKNLRDKYYEKTGQHWWVE
jgi:hypothetical protein